MAKKLGTTMFKRSLISAIDQAVVSGLNFCVGLVLIATVSKPEYGLYVQLFACGVLLTAMTDALVGNAITNMLAREGRDQLETLLRQAQAFVQALAVVMAAMAGLVAYGLAHKEHGATETLAIAAAFSAYAGSLLVREFSRTGNHLQERPEQVLLLDVVYVGCVFSLGGLMYLFFKLDLSHVFVIMTASNGISQMTSKRNDGSQGNDGTRFLNLSSTDQLKKYWQYTSWAVIGVLVGWLANNLFIFSSAQLLGLSATAELNAARLLLMPLTLIGVAWGQSNRARIADLIQQKNRFDLIGFIRKSLIILLSTCVLYGGLLLAMLPLLLLVGPFAKYGQLNHLLWWWLPYMLLFVSKFTATVVLSVFEVYRPMLTMTFTSMCLQFALLMWIPQQTNDAASVIWCLMIAEIFELTVMWLYLMPNTLKARGFHDQAS